MVITCDLRKGYLPAANRGYRAKILAVSEIEFIGYPTSFEVEIVLAGMREAAKKMRSLPVARDSFDFGSEHYCHGLGYCLLLPFPRT
jgi:hypothetical protein